MPAGCAQLAQSVEKRWKGGVIDLLLFEERLGFDHRAPALLQLFVGRAQRLVVRA